MVMDENQIVSSLFELSHGSIFVLKSISES